MKLSLNLKLGQQLTMTPQLRQAIRLLQLSTIDLQQEIQEALESNPMLEIAEDDGPLPSDEPGHINAEADDTGDFPALSNTGLLQESEQGDYEGLSELATEQSWNESQDLPVDVAADSSWEDIYSETVAGGSFNMGAEGDDLDFESRSSASETLQDHLNWQLNLTPMSDGDRLIAMAIIDAINADGMLTASIESIHAGLIRELDIDEDEVLAILHRIQQFDPVGVGYRDLRECLSLQLQHTPADHPGLDAAKKIVAGYLSQLASHDYAFIMKRLKIKEGELKQALKLILSLNPKPGADIAHSDTAYVVPDVFVSKDNGRWKVELNPDTAPRIRINADYAALVQRNQNGADNTFLRDNLQEARWFIKSLLSRNETLMKVARKIVEHQKNFLEYGEEAMKPLVLHDIAEAVDMHESTISRVTTQKYMHTPRGIFELKYFFSSHVSTESGGECSSTAIRAIIKKLVAAESPQKPLSDSKIADLLAVQGVNVARRTIAKYRESLAIAPSNERKRLL
ncbi:MAG: RNA polymerase factor sigma-54 [Pseudomonadales bacterium]|nr:RNA polymerase factor sigma-54 [Pseudomonadales bacterium]